MDFLRIFLAAVAAYAFGAVWYMSLGKIWVVAAGVECGADGRPTNKSMMPFLISFIAAVIVAGMMSHIFDDSGITTVGKGLASGFGLGAFIVLPWIVTNYAYSFRPRNLSLIDGGYAVIACTIIGTVLTAI